MAIFTGDDLQSMLADELARVSREINFLPEKQFLAVSVETLQEHFIAKYCVATLELDLNRMRLVRNTRPQLARLGRISANGARNIVASELIKLNLIIPYRGEDNLWTLRPGSISMPPDASQTECNADNHVIIVSIQLESADHGAFEAKRDYTLGAIDSVIAAQAEIIKKYASDLQTLVHRDIQTRRQWIERVHGLVAAINIPLVTDASVPNFEPVELLKRIVRPLPIEPTEFQPEPAIDSESYEHLLSLIRHAGRSFEGTPATYKNFNEDDLRNIVLSHINAVYKGAATGETFRGTGKTDIRLEVESRSAFVAECKIWDGSKALLDGLEQLLGYLTWRDGKVALIAFNKDSTRFKQAQLTLGAVLENHPLFIMHRPFPCENEGEWRCVFRSIADADREVVVHVFSFNLFARPLKMRR